MRRYFLIGLLFLSLPAVGAISPVRSNATWNTSTQTTCQVSLSATNAGDLLALWTYWRTSGTNGLSVLSVTGLGFTFPSAVGQTLQSASNTAAQIFYLPSITGNTTPVNFTVTFSGSAGVSSGCVVAEYSGADQNYPLDSASAGYSTSGNPTSLLDSGNAAPANSNLMVFAGGVAAPNIAIAAGSGFTSLQASHGSWGTGIGESSTAAISGNNTLQRATACLGTCPGTTPGNWLMQMAVFRDESWTVGGGWTPVRTAQILDASQFPGSDIGAQINSALVAAVSPGCRIHIPSGTYNFTTPIIPPVSGLPCIIEGDGGGTILQFAKTSGVAVDLAWSGPKIVTAYGLTARE